MTSLVAGIDADEEQIKALQEAVLKEMASRISEKVESDSGIAFITDYPDSDGYYIAQVTKSAYYTLQEEVQLEDYDPPLVIPASEIVCRGKL
jgi:hypothetical protein